MLLDYGRETFAKLEVSGLNPSENTKISFGESMEEALDWENAFKRLELSGNENSKLSANAFRYIYIYI